jgi:alpha,alpha-trehalase
MGQALSILDYIKRTWTALKRSNRDLAAAAVDPKFRPFADGRWPVYVAGDEDFGRVEQHLRQAMEPSNFQKIDLRRLPDEGSPIPEPGLLYLPKPYVVPGGRFNEMYGWDSYFIQMGLLRDGYLEAATDMADNFLYEIRHYGKIVNANRTYYLTRSHPPFLTQMLLAVYQRTRDRQWLADSLDAVEKYYGYWTSAPHLTPETGLSRYFDAGEGPAPEVVSSEVDAQGCTDYELVRQYFRTHPTTDYEVSQYYDAANDRLTALFYKGDRSMRESGFDPSNRFGPFSAGIIDYNPVCLNSLLYLMEIQTAEILTILGRGNETAGWRKKAQDRALAINHLMWDERQGMYFDYQFAQQRRRQYPFLTTFYPMWAAIASRDQAGRVAGNLAMFEKPGGLQTSTNQSGDQWDAPFGWAPLQWIAVQALRQYGYQAEADHISMRFLSLVLREFEEHGAVSEKYDVVHGRADAGGILFGYRSNEPGFGWTNAVFTALLDGLPPAGSQQLLGSHK